MHAHVNTDEYLRASLHRLDKPSLDRLPRFVGEIVQGVTCDGFRYVLHSVHFLHCNVPFSH